MLCFSHFLFLSLKLSPKSEELQQNTTESQKRLNELEDLKEQLESRDSRLQTMEKEKTLIAEQLQQTLVEVRTLIQEKEDLKQLQKSLQIERDQLKSDTRDTVNMVRLWLSKLWKLRASVQTVQEKPSLTTHDPVDTTQWLSLFHMVLMEIVLFLWQRI